jgi:hypothetical protein
VLNGAPQFVGRPEGELQWQADVGRERRAERRDFQPARFCGPSRADLLLERQSAALLPSCATPLSLSLSLSSVSVFLYVQFRVSVFGDLQLSQQHRTCFHIDPNLPSLSCMQLLRSALVVGYQIAQYQSFFSLLLWVFFFWLLLVVVAVVDFLRPLVEAPCVRYGVKMHRWLKLLEEEAAEKKTPLQNSCLSHE